MKYLLTISILKFVLFDRSRDYPSRWRQPGMKSDFRLPILFVLEIPFLLEDHLHLFAVENKHYT